MPTTLPPITDLTSQIADLKRRFQQGEKAEQDITQLLAKVRLSQNNEATAQLLCLLADVKADQRAYQEALSLNQEAETMAQDTLGLVKFSR